MQKGMETLLSGIKFGEAQVCGNMTVLPVVDGKGKGIEYLTLNEAMEKDVLTIEELNEGGDVPQLRAINRAERPVLLIDGEELSGAKQNRIVNITILLQKQSETVIPVSCTEAGRWRYTTMKFAASGEVANRRMRAEKAASVSDNLQFHGEALSDQSAVWDGVGEISASAGVDSLTSAMKDVYEAKSSDLDKYLNAFGCGPAQVGAVVMVDGEVVGFDMVLQPSAYAQYHRKLMRSYAIEAVVTKPSKAKKEEDPDVEGKARAFLDELASSEEMKKKATGMGWDCRYKSKGTVGAALMYRNKAVHTVFLRLDEQQEEGLVPPTSVRRERLEDEWTE